MIIKVLYLDFLCPKGHVRQNTEFINALSEFSDVTVLSPKGHYKHGQLKAKIIEEKIIENLPINRIRSLKVMLWAANVARKVDPDYIFVASYDTISYAIGRCLFFTNECKTFLLHHNNIDELESNIKRWFFKSYMKNVEHVVFEEFIRGHIVKTLGLDMKRIHLLPHQLNHNYPLTKFENKYSCIGLSNSNDEKMICEIIDIEKQRGLLEKSGKKVILKSRGVNFDNGFLKVVNGYLSDEEYNDYINHCESVLIPFPKTFRHRMSGTLVDALSNNKIVFGNDIPLMRYYGEKYPLTCKILTRTEDIFDYILDLKTTENTIEEFNRFKEEHSSRVIIESLRHLLGG